MAASVQFEVTETVPVPPRAVEPEPVAQVPFPKVIVELASIAFVTEEAGSVNPPVTVNPTVLIVEVARIFGATRFAYIVEVGAWKFAIDWMERAEPGEEVPIPTFPAKLIKKGSSVELPKTKLSAAPPSLRIVHLFIPSSESLNPAFSVAPVPSIFTYVLPVPFTCSLFVPPSGSVVPIPTFPPKVAPLVTLRPLVERRTLA